MSGSCYDIQQFSIIHGVEINYALPSILVARRAFIHSFSERSIESMPHCQGAETAPLRFNGAVRLHQPLSMGQS